MNTEDLDLPAMINTLRGEVSYDDLARAVDNTIGSQTLQRFGDRNRPFSTPVRVESLISAAEAISKGTPRTTSPWALWIAHGVSFERTHGMWGRPDDRALGALGLLPPGWHDLSLTRLAAWNRVGSSFILEQHAEQRREDDARTIAELRARCAELEAQAAKQHGEAPNSTAVHRPPG